MKHLLVKSALFVSSAVATAQSFDPTFGTGGKTTLQAYPGLEYSLVDTKVLANGDIYTLGNNYTRRLNFSDILIRKFNKDGQLVWQETINRYYNDYGSALTIDDDGGLAMVGYTVGWGGVNDVFILRWDAAGNSKIGISLNGAPIVADLEPTSLTTDGAGNYIVGALNKFKNSNNFYAIKADTSGVVSGFGTDGVAEVDLNGGHDAAKGVWAEGNTIVLTGSSTNAGAREPFVAVALNANDGSLKTGFGNGGKLLFNVSNTGNDRANNIVKLANGKLLLSGYSKLPTRSVVALASFDPQTGAFDSGFDGDGKRLIYLSGQSDISTDAVVHNGDLYLGGMSSQYNGELKSVIVKILADGSNDYSFGSLGTYVLDQKIGGYGNHNVALGFQNDHKPVVASTTDNGEPLVMRLNALPTYSARVANASEDLDAEAMSVYPNPAIDRVTCTFAQDLTAELEGARLDVVDVYGNTVMQDIAMNGNSVALSVDQLKAGVYSAKVTTLNGKLAGTTKFVVQP